MPIASINPATGETLKNFRPHSRQDVERKISSAEKAFYEFRETCFSQRSEWMKRAADILESEKESIGKTMTLEIGKPFEAAMEEAIKCAWACRYYAENAGQMLADETIITNASRSFVRYQPLGIILAIMPWNFPFWQVFRFAAPALMAGNVGLLKHASNVPQCAVKIEEIFRMAGFPDGVFQTLLIGSTDVKAIIEDPRVKAITLTGSEPAGSSVASLAGKLIKKTVLELGGSDPFIVMPSADIEEAAKTAVRARVVNNGQSCIAAKRFIVHESIFEKFTGKFRHEMESLVVGDPMLKGTQLGPIASEDLLIQLDNLVKRSTAMGAKVLTGAKRLQRLGSYYAPTILTNVSKNSPTYYEEFFGPVALLFQVKNIDEAIHLANDSPFGLGSAAWTNDQSEQQRFINELDSGLVFINSMVASDPRLPFGGIKHSGFGRELGTHGIKEFVNIKTVWVR